MRCDTHSTLGHPRAAVVVAVVVAVAIVVVDRDQELRISKQVKNTQLLVSWDGIMLANLRVGCPESPRCAVSFLEALRLSLVPGTEGIGFWTKAVNFSLLYIKAKDHFFIE